MKKFLLLSAVLLLITTAKAQTKRTNIKDANDRYINKDTALYLLKQKNKPYRNTGNNFTVDSVAKALPATKKTGGPGRGNKIISKTDKPAASPAKQ